MATMKNGSGAGTQEEDLGSGVPLYRDKHIAFIKDLQEEDSLVGLLTEHLRLNGMYWGVTALALLGAQEALDRDGVVRYIGACWDDRVGAFGAHPGHDGHLLATLSAVQILVQYDALAHLDSKRVVKFVQEMHDPRTGRVTGDRWGEVDTRFAYEAVSILSLLGHLDTVDWTTTIDWIKACQNHDGGFGVDVGCESHSGQVLVCVSALAILGRLDLIDADRLGGWLCERQLPCGGLNGRPEKLEDVCYSWWVFASLTTMGRGHWVDSAKLGSFILSAQDAQDGGIADRPGDQPDVFHTVFGIAGLSLLGYPNLEAVDPVYCMPVATIDRLGLYKGWGR